MQKININFIFLLCRAFFCLFFSTGIFAKDGANLSQIRPVHEWREILRVTNQHTLVISDIQGTLIGDKGLTIRDSAWEILKASSAGVVGFSTASSSSGIIFSEVDYKLSEEDQKTTIIDKGCFCSSEKNSIILRFIEAQVRKSPTIQSIVVVDDTWVILRSLEHKLKHLHMPFHVFQFAQHQKTTDKKTDSYSLSGGSMRKDFALGIVPILKPYSFSSLAQLMIGEYLGEDKVLVLIPPETFRESFLSVPGKMLLSPTASPRDENSSPTGTKTLYSPTIPSTPSPQIRETAVGETGQKYVFPAAAAPSDKEQAPPHQPPKKSFLSFLSCCFSPQNTAKVSPE